MEQFFGFMMNPATFTAAKELQKLAESVASAQNQADRDRQLEQDQGAMLMAISDLLFAQEAFINDVHDSKLKAKFQAITSVPIVTPSSISRVQALRIEIMSLIRFGFSRSCSCDQCTPLQKKDAEDRLMWVNNDRTTPAVRDAFVRYQREGNEFVAFNLIPPQGEELYVSASWDKDTGFYLQIGYSFTQDLVETLLNLGWVEDSEFYALPLGPHDSAEIAATHLSIALQDALKFNLFELRMDNFELY